MGVCVSTICGPCGAGLTKRGNNDSKELKSTPSPTITLLEQQAVPEPEPEEAPKKPAPTTPITLETLQGPWVNSMGAKISVSGTEVTLNGVMMKMHPIKLDDDGVVTSIGRIWQMNGWLEDEQIEFKEAPSREVMQFARSVVWSKATDERMEQWTKQMEGLGYSGSAADPLNRGIEGCCPGTSDAKAKVTRDDANQDKEDLSTLNRLLSEWREPGMFEIRPRQVVPDFSNRGHTGLSVEHVHYLATQFQDKGFQKRVGNQGHDIPVLIRDTPSSELGSKAVSNWRAKLDDEKGFPPREHYERLFGEAEMFTSLGNGHFNQALNLFLTESKSIYNGKNYVIGNDIELHHAIHVGISALVLKSSIPLRDRETISKLLNSKREFAWGVNADGSLNILDAAEDTSSCKQFIALSKVLDAQELNCLVRAELGVKDSHRMGQ